MPGTLAFSICDSVFVDFSWYQQQYQARAPRSVDWRNAGITHHLIKLTGTREAIPAIQYITLLKVFSCSFDESFYSSTPVTKHSEPLLLFKTQNLNLLQSSLFFSFAENNRRKKLIYTWLTPCDLCHGLL